jgi:YD repeat-containing protein
VRTDDDTTRTLITYDAAKVRVTSVEPPVPTTGALRPRHNFTYTFGTIFDPLNPDHADMDIVGTSGASTFDRRAVLDARGRTVKDVGIDGLATTFEWDSGDRLLSTTDAAGRKSTTILDVNQRPTDTTVRHPPPGSTAVVPPRHTPRRSLTA